MGSVVNSEETWLYKQMEKTRVSDTKRDFFYFKMRGN